MIIIFVAEIFRKKQANNILRPNCVSVLCSILYNTLVRARFQAASEKKAKLPAAETKLNCRTLKINSKIGRELRNCSLWNQILVLSGPRNSI